MTLRLVSIPGSVQGLFEAAKDHARVDGHYDDALVDADLASAVEQVERAARVGFVGATWEWYADAFPSGNICIGFGPITEVVSITYRDADGIEQTLDPAEYEADALSQDGVVSGTWPVAGEYRNAVKVTFKAGDGRIPAPIHRAIRMMVASGYDDREEGGELTGPAQRLVGMYRRPWC